MRSITRRHTASTSTVLAYMRSLVDSIVYKLMQVSGFLYTQIHAHIHAYIHAYNRALDSHAHPATSHKVRPETGETHFHHVVVPTAALCLYWLCATFGHVQVNLFTAESACKHSVVARQHCSLNSAVSCIDYITLPSLHTHRHPHGESTHVKLMRSGGARI